MKANDFVALALKSPLYAIMGDTMLLTVTGRRTGRKISLPVNYYSEGDSLWIVTSRDRTWWRNLAQGSDVEVHLRGQDFKGFGEAIVDEAVVAAKLKTYLRRLPSSARYLDIQVQDGIPNCDDLERAAGERLFVRICISS
jgi:deazaflavin-dependent oxidoreductase (nitroreductase family)